MPCSTAAPNGASAFVTIRNAATSPASVAYARTPYWSASSAGRAIELTPKPIPTAIRQATAPATLAPTNGSATIPIACTTKIPATIVVIRTQRWATVVTIRPVTDNTPNMPAIVAANVGACPSSTRYATACTPSTKTPSDCTTKEPAISQYVGSRSAARNTSRRRSPATRADSSWTACCPTGRRTVRCSGIVVAP